jgi:hypothetical protein
VLFGGVHYDLIKRTVATKGWQLGGEDLVEATFTGIGAKDMLLRLDPREKHIALLFEYGHTIGHALELTEGTITSHGEGVAIGMALAFAFSAKLGLCPGQDVTRVVRHLEAVGLPAGGYMAAVLALMETPAILTALLLLNGAGRGEPGRRRTILKEVFVGAAMVMLLGSFLVGVVSGNAGMAKLELFVGPLFQGALCFFLLDIGLIAARRLMEGGRKLSPGVIGFALGFPLLSAAVALGLARFAGLDVGNAALLTILAGSASYIAVPAAMRLAAPEADTGVFVTASLAITFPFNLTVGIALYTAAAAWLWA